MKVIIAGSRNINSIDSVKWAVRDSGFEVTEVISGAAKGVDTAGECWAQSNQIDRTVFHANWHKWGKAAGPKRNERMASYADALIAIPEPGSKGTKSMIEIAKKAGLKVYIHREFL